MCACVCACRCVGACAHTCARSHGHVCVHMCYRAPGMCDSLCSKGPKIRCSVPLAPLLPCAVRAEWRRASLTGRGRRSWWHPSVLSMMQCPPCPRPHSSTSRWPCRWMAHEVTRLCCVCRAGLVVVHHRSRCITGSGVQSVQHVAG